MPGINQLGGALVATAAPKATTGAEGNANAVAQSNTANQVVSTDAVKGPTRALPPQAEANDEGADRVRRERRSFQDLAQSRGAAASRKDPVDVVQIQDADEDEELANASDERDQVELSSATDRQAAAKELAAQTANVREKQSESKARLRAVMNDLFAPRPRSQTSANDDLATQTPAARDEQA